MIRMILLDFLNGRVGVNVDAPGIHGGAHFCLADGSNGLPTFDEATRAFDGADGRIASAIGELIAGREALADFRGRPGPGSPPATPGTAAPKPATPAGNAP